MKIKNVLLSCLMLMGLSAQAQEAETVYEFQPHWNVTVQPLGAQYTLGEVSFSDLVSYNIQAGVGYQFSPIFGARATLNAWQSKAGWDMGDQLTWKWNYIAPMIDITANLSNLVYGYNPERLFSLGAFAGIGANVAWGNDDAATVKAQLADYYQGHSNQNLSNIWDGTKFRFAAHAGLTADFRINDMVSVGLELQANTVNDNYNSKEAGSWDWYFNALAGVKVNLGKTYNKKTVVPVVQEPQIIEKIVEKIVEKEVPVIQEVVKKEPFRRDIFFTISSTKIIASEMLKVAEIANYMKENPEATIQITGYADKGTGNAKINNSLSAKRAKIVVDTLVNKYGIDASRIKSGSKGDTEQPYTEPILNRVSICIAQ